MVVLDEHECGLPICFLKDGIREYLVGLPIALPIPQPKSRPVKRDMAERHNPSLARP